MMADLAHQKLGHLGPSHLSSAVAHKFGMSPKLSSQFHPMLSCKFALMPKSSVVLEVQHPLSIIYHLPYSI